LPRKKHSHEGEWKRRRKKGGVKEREEGKIGK